MKTLKLSLFAVAGMLMLSISAFAQQATVKKAGPAPAAATPAKPAQPSEISWKEDSFDFGTIEKGKPVSHDFTFKNTTKQTILITDVKASCGCTATNYTKTPIKPGETGSVTATYNAANPGNFSKTVTVTTNDSSVNKVLTIKGKVEGGDTPAPVQKS
ncbi:hypothetical protein CHU92_05595 [Flavobacterium cyanobacteriorum]|uniref:DUF1573 domain-containing protein n=1 Tax=Flavobacterium cyanobacteriorum TaxID=2022802 RepID=A0A255ZA26_9FLAO|nr:DUF1573 domain-containing protein [Flavobacterium cyanobacteriorum]OYQ38306.1 hypothetical protein CHU92_05595 [Flavobacterium cyanobacteriorum]